MGLALYRKYRSRTLDEIVGQEHVTKLLSRSLLTDRVAHAYLFTGPRGTGKTSIARIMAHEINGLQYNSESSHLDIIEIDAASNNGVDDIRDLREKVKFAPSSAKKKVYIIDEVHMLSKPAFNALLKTLEEPPDHVVFILATTDVDKLPQTIVSRTQRYTFHRASVENIMINLNRIVKAEKIKITEGALRLIAQHSDGGYRDSVSLLDQLTSTSAKDEEITEELIESSLGLAPTDAMQQLIVSLEKKDFNGVIAQLKLFESTGIQPKIIASQLIEHISDTVGDTPELLPLIDQLMLVGQSTMPSAKLLACLGLYSAPLKRTVMPQVVSKPTVSAPVGQVRAPAPTPPVETGLEELEHEAEAEKPTMHRVSGEEVDFDMKELLVRAKEESIALSSVLKKCDIVQDGDILVIYAKNEFYKKKLETPRYRQQLNDILQHTTGRVWESEVIPSAKPSSDSNVAAVAAMMGGGEEVSTDSL